MFFLYRLCKLLTDIVLSSIPYFLNVIYFTRMIYLNTIIFNMYKHVITKPEFDILLLLFNLRCNNIYHVLKHQYVSTCSWIELYCQEFQHSLFKTRLPRIDPLRQSVGCMLESTNSLFGNWHCSMQAMIRNPTAIILFIFFGFTSWSSKASHRNCCMNHSPPIMRKGSIRCCCFSTFSLCFGTNC